MIFLGTNYTLLRQLYPPRLPLDILVHTQRIAYPTFQSKFPYYASINVSIICHGGKFALISRVYNTLTFKYPQLLCAIHRVASGQKSGCSATPIKFEGVKYGPYYDAYREGIQKVRRHPDLAPEFQEWLLEIHEHGMYVRFTRYII